MADTFDPENGLKQRDDDLVADAMAAVEAIKRAGAKVPRSKYNDVIYATKMALCSAHEDGRVCHIAAVRPAEALFMESALTYFRRLSAHECITRNMIARMLALFRAVEKSRE